MKTKDKTTETKGLKKIKTDQGERLKAFRIEKEFFRKSTFARHIKSSEPTISAIENHGRKISDSVMDLITYKFSEINPEWLRNGKLPRILTIEKDSISPDLSEEGVTPYQINCPECKKRDEEIKRLLSKVIEVQDELNDCRKEVSALEKTTSG